MNWKSWLFIVVVVPVIGLILFIFSSSVFPKRDEPKTTVVREDESIPLTQPLVSFVDPWKGAESPRIIIIEYGDYACPYCRQMEASIDRLLTERDDVRFVWKDLPNSVHPGADIAAEAAQCAKDQGKFWEFHDTLFKQSSLFNQTSLMLAANNINLDLETFGNCLAGGKKKYLIQRSVTEAEALEIDGTPYFFINGQRYSGQLNYDQLTQIIDTL